MPLSAGTRLGSYEVRSLLGVGGMGEVYLARDTKLGRDVAVKVISDAFAQDPDRLARFTREAQVLASMNHPNIAAIFGVEDRALVMELVEGETLEDHIKREAIPAEPARLLIDQIIDALEYAHEKGVVHRDLKPANIKITPEGRIKVLDFGLAKALASETAAAADPVSSPTLTMRATTAGVIMGTAAYMPPEQARGQNVDKRADIWSFGVVVDEMLTGRPLFASATVSDTLAAVLKEEPDISSLPEPFRKLVRLCLVKDPRRRMRDIGDARIILSEPLTQPAVTSATAVQERGRLPKFVIPLLAALALIAVALAFQLWRSPRPLDPPLLWLNVDLGPDAIPGRDLTAAISPDGSQLVFPIRAAGGKQLLATRLLSEPKVTPLIGTEDGQNPFYSPDGQWIAFFADHQLKKVSAKGGAPVNLCFAPAGRGGSWSPDGSIVASLSTAVALSRIPEAGGTPQALFSLQNGELTQRWPQVLPGNQSVLFTSHTVQANFDEANIDVFTPGTGQRKTVQRGAYYGRYLPTGQLIYIRQGTLFGAPFDLAKLEVTGAPVPLVENIKANASFGGGQFDFSKNGALVYLSGKSSDDAWQVIWVDNSGKIEPAISTPRRYIWPRLSPDGTRLAADEAFEPGKSNVWIYDLERDARTKLTFTGSDRMPVWAPDGKHLAYGSQAGTSWLILWIRADGAGQPQRLMESKVPLAPRSFSNDGRRLAFSQRDPGNSGRTELWTLPLDSAASDHPIPGQSEVLLRTAASNTDAAFSPDGHWIAYMSDESGVPEIYVRPFGSDLASMGKSQVSTGGGVFPIWSRAGRQLFYQVPGSGDHIMVADYTVTGSSFQAGKPRQWTELQVRNLIGLDSSAFDLAPDGKRVLMMPQPVQDEPLKGNLQLSVVLNWFDELRKHVGSR